MLIRLQKVISQAGVASRRKAEEWIAQGRVTVNGRAVTQLGTKVDPDRDKIQVEGRLILSATPKLYVMMNKPRGVVTTLSDPEGRPTVKDLLRGVPARLFPVGRLDYDTEGLLLLTNDGELAHALMHPSSEVPKTYHAKVKGRPTEAALKKLSRGGMPLVGGETSPCVVRPLKTTESNAWVEVTLHEGKKRQVRRMLERVGHPVLKLKRVRYAFLSLGNLDLGEFRHLTASEVKRLKKAGHRSAGAGASVDKHFRR
jgi:pseudouridine synthase